MIIDGHNDLALRTWLGEPPLHLDLEAAAAVGFAGGFFAVYVPGPPVEMPDTAPYEVQLPDPIPYEEARRVANELADVLAGLAVTIVRTIDDFAPGRVGAIMHLEGADPLAPDLSELGDWYARGLRSIGIVWSRPNAFGEGVPFRFPASPDTGPGLTAAGLSLVHACNVRGILVDLSHLNEAGFWDVARVTQAPLVATHSNAHALCRSTRNLTDRQLDAIGESGGVVGVNFACGFLRADGRNDPATPLAEIVRHVDYLVSRIGIDHVAFGSDFEGAVVPAELGGAAGLPRLVSALRARGYDEEALEKITCRNWLRVLDATWHQWGEYFRLASVEPRATLVDAAGRFSPPGRAVDLGAGTGRDTAELLRRGWSVLAIDREQDAIDRLRRLVGGDSATLETRIASFEDATWPLCDLVNASFALPFCAPASFSAVWQRIVDSLRPGGRFSGQFFGERDEWAGTGLVIHARADIDRLLAPFEVESLEEFDGQGTTISGKPKHWHVFHVVARKR